VVVCCHIKYNSNLSHGQTAPKTAVHQMRARVWENANFETEKKARCFTPRRSHAQKERLLSRAPGRAGPGTTGSPSTPNGTLFDAIQMAWPAWRAPRSVANKAHCLRTGGCQSFLGAWSRPLAVCWHVVGVAERQVRGRCFEERVSLRWRVYKVSDDTRQIVTCLHCRYTQSRNVSKLRATMLTSTSFCVPPGKLYRIAFITKTVGRKQIYT